jgi:hypothetical protein
MVPNLIKDFLHSDREKVEEMVVFLHKYADYFKMVTNLFKDFFHPGRCPNL